MQMDNKYMKRINKGNNHRYTQIKLTKYKLTPVRWPLSARRKMSIEDVEKREPLCTVVKNVN